MGKHIVVLAQETNVYIFQGSLSFTKLTPCLLSFVNRIHL